MLPFTGVARKAWMLPASGPLSRIALPEICPRSLILLAMVAKRLALAGNSVLRSGEAVVRHLSLLQPDIQVSCVPVPQNQPSTADGCLPRSGFSGSI